MNKLVFFALLVVSSHASPFFGNLLSNLIPASRRGRAGLVGSDKASSEEDVGSIRMTSDASEDTRKLKSLIESVVNGESNGEDEELGEPDEVYVVEEVSEENQPLPLPTLPLPNSPVYNVKKESEPENLDDEYIRKYGYERKSPLAAPRNVDSVLSNFGPQMVEHLRNNPEAASRLSSLPQLALLSLKQRQNNLSSGSTGDLPDSSDDEVRCIPKVMQIEETVYDRSVKCHHSYQEKCHMTYITDYKSTSEEKCETTFKKNCHITFKPMPFNETVRLCHTPVVRQCGDEPVGPEICSTHYETNCETRYKKYEVEQDEPICVMEVMRKCQNITLPFPPDFDPNSTATDEASDDSNNEEPAVPTATGTGSRRKRQTEGEDITVPEEATVSEDQTLDSENADSTSTNEEEGSAAPGGLTLDQNCEEWPVQKCHLEKRTVTKVHPDTACRKIPREVCIPNNCAMVQGEEICRDEERMLIQNVPQEDCELQPEENCHMEAVLVPRLVQKPNCVKVPKEICVNTKNNPRRVKKPIIKEWCYRPKDLLENPGTFPAEILDMEISGASADDAANTLF